jgi:hypothetical protein
MDEEAVEPQADVQMDQMIDEVQEEFQSEIDQEQPELQEEVQEKKKMVPLHELQKLREKKRELELQLQWEQQRNAEYMKYNPQQKQPEPEEDNSRYESATREDLSRSQGELMRHVEESIWAKQNPEKYEYVNENLPKFLKQRPNLASAIGSSTNRYEEAYTLMDALTPKENKIAKSNPQVAPKKVAPNSPGGVPKATALNNAVDVMNMSDKEFAEWRSSQRKRR